MNTASRLFRAEVLAHTDTGNFGNRLFLPALSARNLAISAALIAVLIFSFAYFVELNQIQNVRGFLAPVEGITSVSGGRQGVYDAIYVVDGQLVAAGDRLASISSAVTDNGGQLHSTVLLVHLDQQKDQLQAKYKLLSKQYQTEELQLQDRATTYQQELQLLREDYAISLEQLALQEWETNKSAVLLARDLISQSEHNRQLAMLLTQQQSAKSRLLQISNREQTQRETVHQLNTLSSRHETEQLELQSRLLELAMRRSELEIQANSLVTAPVAGRIHNLLVNPGDLVDPGQPLLYLLPEQFTLETIIPLPSAASGEIHIGQQILLFLDAFPYQSFGSISATVTHISATPIKPAEFPYPLELRESVYLLKAALDKQDESWHTRVALRPGQQLSADIIVDRKTLLERILSPFAAMRSRL